MHKLCPCGQNMGLKLRTVIYSGKLEIDNVPIYSCDACQHSEVKPSVKTELKGIINELGVTAHKKSVRFNEFNEWADVLINFKIMSKNCMSSERIYQTMLEERVNDLLDLYLLAGKLNDKEWINSIQKRLEQLSSL